MAPNDKTFAALANRVRLSVFRLLVEHGPDGLPAGQIAMKLDVPGSTLSTHLAQLERAGLLRSWREQQRRMYCIDVDGTKNLIDFLVNDCCSGHPEICGFKRAPATRSKIRAGRRSRAAS
jgi:DNA-binding transcriptional ArsR family regulator